MRWEQRRRALDQTERLKREAEERAQQKEEWQTALKRVLPQVDRTVMHEIRDRLPPESVLNPVLEHLTPVPPPSPKALFPVTLLPPSPKAPPAKTLLTFTTWFFDGDPNRRIKPGKRFLRSSFRSDNAWFDKLYREAKKNGVELEPESVKPLLHTWRREGRFDENWQLTSTYR